jgi:hypothetical protein
MDGRVIPLHIVQSSYVLSYICFNFIIQTLALLAMDYALTRLYLYIFEDQ